MSRQIVTLKKLNSNYCLCEGGKNLHVFCYKDFDRIAKIIGNNGKDLTYNAMKVNSVKFVGLRKASENSKDCFFLVKDLDSFEVWNYNPVDLWSEEDKWFYNKDSDADNQVISFSKDWFERVTGIRKQAIFKMRDVYRFTRIDIKVSEL